MSEGDEPEVESAPEDSVCAVHPDRTALVTCPRCGSYCCITCWHQGVKRCHACLLRDPPPPAPWADRERSWPSRFFSTLLDALSPGRAAPAFANGRWQSGISFALLTFLPLALIAGVIPFTHTLGFGPSWAITAIGRPDQAAIGFDVLSAMGIGALLGAAKLVLLAVPYISLTNAYGKVTESMPARQVLLYRAWLVPLGGRSGLLLGLVVWGLPMEPSEAMLALAEIVSLLPLMLVLWSMIATARVAGVGPIAAMVVVLVPFLVMFLVEPLILGGLSSLHVLPDPGAMRDAVQAATPTP